MNLTKHHGWVGNFGRTVYGFRFRLGARVLEKRAPMKLELSTRSQIILTHPYSMQMQALLLGVLSLHSVLIWLPVSLKYSHSANQSMRSAYVSACFLLSAFARCMGSLSNNRVFKCVVPHSKVFNLFDSYYYEFLKVLH